MNISGPPWKLVCARKARLVAWRRFFEQEMRCTTRNSFQLRELQAANQEVYFLGMRFGSALSPLSLGLQKNRGGVDEKSDFGNNAPAAAIDDIASLTCCIGTVLKMLMVELVHFVNSEIQWVMVRVHYVLTSGRSDC